MSIRIRNLTIKNFMSVGNATQAVSFEEAGLTLVIGENLDQGGGEANRNGVGKTTMINALSYALFGSALTNIRMPNLVNKSNGKNMMVTLEFSKGGTNYRIERGRSPNVLKFLVDGVESGETDEGQGEMRLTQEEIGRVFGMSHEMFKQIVALNTYATPFLSLNAAGQRDIIESLLGVTELSEKAEILKERIRNSKDRMVEEESRIEAARTANERVQRSIDDLKGKRRDWAEGRRERIAGLKERIAGMGDLDLDGEIEAHRTIAANAVRRRENEALEDALREAESAVRRAKAKSAEWAEDRDGRIESARARIGRERDFDAEAEIAAHRKRAEIAEAEKDRADCVKARDSFAKSIEREERRLAEIERDLESLEDSKCFACGQAIRDGSVESMREEKRAAAEACRAALESDRSEMASAEEAIALIGEIPEAPETRYGSEDEARDHQSRVASLESRLEALESETDPHAGTVDECAERAERAREALGAAEAVPDDPETRFESADEAHGHLRKAAELQARLDALEGEEDPYGDQIEQLERDGLQEVSWDEINELEALRRHQDYLLKLLTNKDSFIRKRIIDQNLAFLNSRLESHLAKLGLPHRVTFNSDLSVDISELGRDLDFDNLSRGERNRLILGLSWSFRDVHESMHEPLDFMSVDELVDSGMDTSGVECAMESLKSLHAERGKNIIVISHRDELMDRADATIHVVKEDGFTRFESRD